MEIVITGTSMSAADRRRADAVPIGELSKLTDEQKAIAKKFGLTEEAWVRSLLASQYGDARLRDRATALAHVLEQHLPKLVPGVEVEKLIWDVGLEDHKIWLGHNGKNYVIRLHQTDVDDWLESGRPEDIEQLCGAVARQLD